MLVASVWAPQPLHIVGCSKRPLPGRHCCSAGATGRRWYGCIFSNTAACGARRGAGGLACSLRARGLCRPGAGTMPAAGAPPGCRQGRAAGGHVGQSWHCMSRRLNRAPGPSVATALGYKCSHRLPHYLSLETTSCPSRCSASAACWAPTPPTRPGCCPCGAALIRRHRDAMRSARSAVGHPMLPPSAADLRLCLVAQGRSRAGREGSAVGSKICVASGAQVEPAAREEGAAAAAVAPRCAGQVASPPKVCPRVQPARFLPPEAVS